MAQEIADSKLIDTWSSDGLKVKPDISKIIEGWQLGEQPPHEYMNWLQNTFGSKLNHILKNGVASWNNETEYLAGSSVQHNGNVWLCKATNTNSAPTDANANWKRIITVESLTTVLNGYVKNSGDEDIDGIKNFLESPIVPTPTTGTQAANKDYVDNAVTLNINTLDEEITPENTDNLALQETGGLLKKLSFANLVNWIKSFSFGWGQTWQNMTASRSSGVTYTNNTDKPIAVLISGRTNSASQGVSSFTVNDVKVFEGNTSTQSVAYDYRKGAGVFIVPAGSSYSAEYLFSSGTIWSELR